MKSPIRRPFQPYPFDQREDADEIRETHHKLQEGLARFLQFLVSFDKEDKP